MVMLIPRYNIKNRIFRKNIKRKNWKRKYQLQVIITLCLFSFILGLGIFYLGIQNFKMEITHKLEKLTLMESLKQGGKHTISQGIQFNPFK